MASELREGVSLGATEGERLAAVQRSIKQEREVTRSGRSASASCRGVAELHCLIAVEIDAASAKVEDDRVVP